MGETTQGVLDGLRYIADSPAQEHGGFHPNAVQTAKLAILHIDALSRLLYRAIRELEYVQQVPGALAASSEGRSIIDDGMAMLGVKDLSEDEFPETTGSRGER